MSIDVAQRLIRISVNGEPKDVPSNLSIADLLTYLELPLERLAVELNKNIVRKRDWHSAQVSSGAQIEIVEFVGGG
jgi:sulfur carrier protein